MRGRHLSPSVNRYPGFVAKLARVVWIAFLVSLPVTSFPYFPATVGGFALVRPLAVYPLSVLLLLTTLPRLLTRKLPKTFLSFLPIVFVILVGILLASARGIDPGQGVSATERMVRALATLGLGGAIYCTVAMWPDNSSELRASLRWLYLGLILAMLWGTLQAIYVIEYSPAYFKLLNKIQAFISIRRLFPHRISGFAYEPNWFADQICLLLFPWLFASVLKGYSVYRWRWRWLTVEWFLLGWAIVVLIFTFSRTGIVILLVLTFLSVLLYRPIRDRRLSELETANVIGDSDELVVTPETDAESSQNAFSKSLVQKYHLNRIGARLAIAGLSVILLSSLIFFVGRQNNYFSRLWRFWLQDTQTGSYFDYIAFGQRLVYWQAAVRIYENYPLFGAGLGNYAFYFEENLPDRSFQAIPEVLRIVTHSKGSERLITPKSLYARLLAETGLLGIAAYLAFLIALLGCTMFLWLSGDPEHQFWGLAGLLGLVVFVINAFSTDSFSIPDAWILFGVVTAVVRIFRE